MKKAAATPCEVAYEHVETSRLALRSRPDDERAAALRSLRARAARSRDGEERDGDRRQRGLLREPPVLRVPERVPGEEDEVPDRGVVRGREDELEERDRRDVTREPPVGSVEDTGASTLVERSCRPG